MLRRIFCLYVCFWAAGAGSIFSAESSQIPKSVLREKAAFEMEYALAKEPQSYFYLSLSKKEIELKARGMVLKKWAIHSTKFWGKPAFPAAVRLLDKSTLATPKRFRIKPGTPDDSGESDPGEYEIDALEIVDMPRNYTFVFDNGVLISVRARSKGILTGIGSLFRLFRWHGIIPIRNLFRTFWGKQTMALEITFEDKQDAQALYWVLYEGICGMIK